MAEKTYTLLVKGQRITVDKAQYKAYYQERERERYLDQVAGDYERSLEQFQEDGVQSVERQLALSVPSPEEIVCRKELFARLHTCMEQLPKQERELLQALYFDGLSEPALSTQTGVSQQLINYRKRKILGKLKKLLER